MIIAKQTQPISQKPQRGDILFVIAHHQQKRISPQKQTHKWSNKLIVDNQNKPQRGVMIIAKRTQPISQKPQRGDILFVIAHHRQK